MRREKVLQEVLANKIKTEVNIYAIDLEIKVCYKELLFNQWVRYCSIDKDRFTNKVNL